MAGFDGQVGLFIFNVYFLDQADVFGRENPEFIYTL